MDYFIMRTDKRLRRLPQIQLPKEFSTMEITKTVFAYVKKYNGMDTEYADYLESPVPLVAGKFQRILQKYQQDMVLQRVMLVEKETGKQKPYFFMKPPEIICADEKEPESDAGGRIQKFVLNEERVGTRKIFLAGDYNRQLMVRLDVAESILRRESSGIWFEPVKTVGRSR